MSGSYKKLGLITYHSAYNFGSVLQALATQQKLLDLGHEVEVIDYRPAEGDRYYKTLYRAYQGPKALLADLTMLPVARLRKERARLFEKFIAENLNLTDSTFREPDDLLAISDRYAVVVSGSDQIFNKKSNELARVGWEYMNPYLLTWQKGHKVSYASSPSDMSDDGLRRISRELQSFDALSCREEDGAARMGKATGRKIPVVCDPTLLLDSNRWSSLVPSVPNKLTGGYLLYYSLLRPRAAFEEMKALVRLSGRLGLPVVVLTPLAGNVPKDAHLVNALASGPAEFLSLLRGAVGVVTESYHGTLFSINYHKPVWVIERSKGADTRRLQVLKKLGLQDLAVSSVDAIEDIAQPDYAMADEKLMAYRMESIEYLRQALRV